MAVVQDHAQNQRALVLAYPLPQILRLNLQWAICCLGVLAKSSGSKGGIDRNVATVIEREAVSDVFALGRGDLGRYAPANSSPI
ncbi:MAG: hypothetical protein M1358_13185 [Chloroflexi bacterium]|nr:hypothetical protein [Chloroflexota bacterium]